MNLGTVYLIVNDFEESVEFYEKLLGMPVSSRNMDRFAQFNGKNISIMNGHFDAEHPDKIVRKGGYDELFDDFRSKALAQNTHKFVLNFWVEDLQKEYERIRSLNLSKNLSKIKYIKNVSPYYYFCLTDPDGYIIEVTGNYSPKEGEFDE